MWNALLETVATQIADDDPPQVWRTADRLLAGGMDRQQVLGQLVLAWSMSEPGPWEDPKSSQDDYLAALARLPVPSDEEIEKAVFGTLAGRRQPIAHDDLVRLTGEQMGAWADDPLLPFLVDQMVDQLMFDGDGSIARLMGDGVVHVESFTAGIVLTHRLSEAERDTDALAVGVDLAGFRCRQQLRLPGGAELERTNTGSPAWVGPPGWLRGFPAGALLAVRVDEDGTARLRTVDEEPPSSDALVRLLDSVYDEQVARHGLPVTADYLVLGMLQQDPRTFSDAVAPSGSSPWPPGWSVAESPSRTRSRFGGPGGSMSGTGECSTGWVPARRRQRHCGCSICSTTARSIRNWRASCWRRLSDPRVTERWLGHIGFRPRGPGLTAGRVACRP